MTYRDDEATTFSKSLNSLQDRREIASDWDDRSYYDSSPGAIADNEVRSAYKQAQAKADLDESFENFHRHSRELGTADSADDLKRSQSWDQYARQNPAQAVAELRTHYLTIPPRAKAVADPPAKNEPVVVLSAAEKEEQRKTELMDYYGDVKRSLAEASTRTSHKESRKRADGTLKELAEGYGSNASHVVNSYIGIDKEMSKDPVGMAPRLLDTIVRTNHELIGLHNAGTEIEAFAEDHPEVSTNQRLRDAMVAELNKMHPNEPNSFEKAYAAAKDQQRGYWYRNANAHQDDAVDDVTLAHKYGRPAKSW